MSTFRKWFVGTGVLAALLAAVGAAFAQGQLPASKGAPKMGEKAPEFTLPDSNGKPVKLSELLASGEAAQKKGNWLLLVFYRGYW